MLVIKRPDSREFIVHLSCITIILLLISHKVVSDDQIIVKPDYYFLDDGEIVKTKDFNRITKRNIDRLVIDLLGQHYISYIHIQYADPHAPKSIIAYKLAGSETRCMMFHDAPFLQKFECKALTRTIVIERDEGVMSGLELYGYETKAEHYVGCFKAKYKEKVHNIPVLEDCAVRCRKLFYYGYNKEEKCICITSLTTLGQVELELCNHMCGTNHQICGTGNIFAMYSQKIFHKNMGLVNPSLDCIFKHAGCPECPGGRKGYRCEIIDCTENNGNCGDMECQTYNLWDITSTSICTCWDGYKIDNIVNCIDDDECEAGTNPCTSFPLNKCVNLPGSYRCSCAQGYNESEPRSCQDIDECADEEKPCLMDDFCINNVGGYLCDCGPGYTNVEDKACIEEPPITETEWVDDSYTRKKYFLFYTSLILITLLVFAALAHRKGR